MAIEKSATTRSSPSANRGGPAPSSDRKESGPSAEVSSGPETDAGRDRDDAGSRSNVLEPEDSVTLSDGQDDFRPNAMRDLSRSLRAEQSGDAPGGEPQTQDARETDSIIEPRSETFDQDITDFATQDMEAAKRRLEEDSYESESARQSDLLKAGRSVQNYVDARNYIDDVAPRPLDSYVPEDFDGTQKERTQAALRARREEGIELMDEVMADTDLTVEERNAALLSVQRHFEYNTARSRQRDPVTLETLHQEPFPKELYGSDTNLHARTNAIVTHDPNKGISPYSITFDPTNKELNPSTHFSSFLRNPSRLGDVAWSELDLRDTIGRAWQNLVH